MKRKLILSAGSALLVLCGSAFSYDLNNPALTPVKLAPAPVHGDLKLVENGKLNFAIVTAKRGKHAKAVGVLSEAFEKCTGAVPEVFDETQLEKYSRFPLLFLIGKSSLTEPLGVDVEKMPTDGFTIRTFDRGVAIIGYDSAALPRPKRDLVHRPPTFQGSLYGALDFVERFMGCRFYYPGDYGTIWPKLKDFTVKPCSYTDGPYFLTRDEYFQVTSTMKSQAQRLNRLLGKMRKDGKSPYFENDRFDMTVRYRLGIAKNFHPMHEPRPEKLMKFYPDKKDVIFFKSVTGYQYYNPKHHEGNDFDLTNLEFADLLIDAMKKYYASNGKDFRIWGDCPSDKYVVFGQCDGEVSLTDMIQNPTVRKLNLITPENVKRGSAMSDVYGRFLQYYANRVKKEFPGVRVQFLAYQGGTNAPLDIKRWTLPDNVDVEYCAHVFPRLARNPEKIARTLDELKRWYVALGNRPVEGLWLYHIPASNASPFLRAICSQFVADIPKACGKYLGRTKLYYDQYGPLDFSYYYSEYVGFRAKWNPNLDVDAAIEEHWVPFYGKDAAPFLKEFHRLLKDAYLKYYVMAPKTDLNPVYPPALINQLEKLLEQAEKVLPKDSIEYKRFLVFKDPWPKAIAAQRLQQNHVRRTAKVYQLLPGEQIAVDGRGDEKFWSKVVPVELMDPKGAGAPFAKPVSLKMVWDKDAIYGLAEMGYPHDGNPDKDIWQNDSWEFFFSPGTGREEFYQIVWDSVGQNFTGQKRLLPISTPLNKDFKIPGLQCKIAKGDGHWSMEFMIPFASLRQKTPRTYSVWTWNAVWNKLGAPTDYKASSMCLGTNANIGQFGYLKFEGKVLK